MISEDRIDEVLETIWMMREEKKSSLTDLKESWENGTGLDELLEEINHRNYISVDHERIHFTQEGEERARSIVRRHRLAERLFSLVLVDLREEQIESTACRVEHILDPEVTENICTFLGHPPVCPHGKPIPSGPCCTKAKRPMKPLVIPLTDLGIGEKAKVIFLTSKYHSRLDQLTVMGLTPGSIVRLHQRYPSFVVEVGETTLALDSDISGEIYVRRMQA